ncbi:MAG: serine/threonine protein kinase, partial [Rubinisphaera sp.]
SGGEKIISYDPRTGKEDWQTPGTAEATCGTIVVAKDIIIASGGYPQSQTIALDGTGQKQWEVKTKLYEPSLIAVGEALFGITDKGIAYCWDVATGAEQWKERLGGSFSASPVAVGNTIYVSNLEGQTFVFKADSSSYQQISVNRLGTDCYASSAVYDENIYLRIGTGNGSHRQEELVCLSRQPELKSSQN